MNKNELERLQKLQKEASKMAGSFEVTEKLTVPDLLLLLREDEQVQNLIREIVTPPATHSSNDEVPTTPQHGMDDDEDDNDDERGMLAPPLRPIAQTTTARISAVAPAPVAVDPLRQQLAPELALLHAVRADTDMAVTWLGAAADEDEGRQLLRVVVCAAQWELLSELWEKLASRCKQDQRAANAAELAMLRAALALHNLRWHGREAQLAEVAAGTPYDYDRHQRGTPSGDTVRALWLPGLVNAGGQLHKKPLVQT